MTTSCWCSAPRTGAHGSTGCWKPSRGQCRRFYSREHLDAGCFVAHNRHGQREEYPLLSLSVGVVHLPAEACQGMDAAHLATLASEAKRQAKAVPGYSLHLIEAA
ncbi:hypothetical protein P4123_16320 [Pseudomonas aeruginosa]|nr:hypothetical protein [Pseudomonas aeruginosa]